MPAADLVEIKRMVVRPAQRRQGRAKAVLATAEEWAGELGYAGCVLETSKKPPEAIGLYQRSGYGFIPNYGQYARVENSVCLQKPIGRQTQGDRTTGFVANFVACFRCPAEH